MQCQGNVDVVLAAERHQNIVCLCQSSANVINSRFHLILALVLCVNRCSVVQICGPLHILAYPPN